MNAELDTARPKVGVLQHVFAVFATLVFFGVNFGLNSDIQNIATKASPLVTLMQAIILAVLLCLALRYRALQWAALPRLGPFLLLLALAVCSSLWSQAPEASLRRSLSLMSLMMFALYAYSVLGVTATCRMQVVATWFAAAASLTAAAVIPRSGFDVGDYAGAIRGVFTQKNTLGDAMVAGVAAAMFLILRRRRIVWTDVATVVMAACVIKLAQSTTALLLLLILLGATVCALLWMRRTAWAFYGLIVIGGLTFCLAWVLVIDPSLFYAGIGKDATLTGRTQIWSAVMNATDGLPLLGYGYAAFWQPDTHVVGDIWYALGWEAPSAHSGYLDTAVQIGVVGLALLAWLAGLTALRAVRSFGAGHQAAAFWALMLLALIAILNTDESSLPQPDVHLLHWILAFLACGATTPRARKVISVHTVREFPDTKASPLAARAPSGAQAFVADRDEDVRTFTAAPSQIVR